MKAIVGCLLAFVCVASALESIRVNIPVSLREQYPDGVPERPAMFGVPSYASSLQGRVIWATPGDRDGCAPLNKTYIDEQLKPRPVPVILLIDRGSCTFVTKVRNAEAVGAIAAIIVDNVDEAGLPFMADDGTGRNIAIPSALIHKFDGAAFKAVLTAPNTSGIVTVTMSWSLPRPDNRVEYDLWSSAIDEQSRSFKNVFQVAAKALDFHAKYTPRYFILNGEDYGCTEPGEPCGSQCTNEGRYCAVDPEHDLGTGLDGRDVVQENLAQLCLYQHLNATCNDNLWWTYVTCFQTNCYPAPPAFGPPTNANWTDACKRDCLARINVNPSVISTCVAQSGGFTGANPLLDNEIYWRQAYGVFYLPTLFVNLTPYRGSLVCPTPIDTAHCGPLAMICGGYLEGTRPDACGSGSGCDPGKYKDACDVCGGNNSTCADCLGVPYGPTKLDSQGKCCAIRSCDDNCNAKVSDSCRVCRLTSDPNFMSAQEGGLDACGECYRFSHPRYNQTCAGCDNVPKSGKQRDACGVCGGGELNQANCASSSVGVGAIIGISLGCVAFAGLGVFFYMRRQQNVLKNDIDSLLKQYLPLDAANSLAHPSTAQGDNLMPESASRSDGNL